MKQKIAKFTGKYAGEILSGLGIASMVGGTVAAIAAEPKVSKIKAELQEADKWTRFKKIAPCYAMSAGLSIAGAACVCASVYTKNQTIAELARVCADSATMIREYRAQISRLKAQDSHLTLLKSERPKTPEPTRATDNMNEYLCIDGITGITFFSNRDKVALAYNVINSELLRIFPQSYSVFQYLLELGIDNPTDFWRTQGWCLQNMDDSVEPVYLGVICETPPYTGRSALLITPSRYPERL